MRYYIRQQRKHVSGPYDLEQIRAWVREGKVRSEMEFSDDGHEWVWGIEMPDLFPPERRRARVRRRGGFV